MSRTLENRVAEALDTATYVGADSDSSRLRRIVSILTETPEERALREAEREVVEAAVAWIETDSPHDDERRRADMKLATKVATFIALREKGGA